MIMKKILIYFLLIGLSPIVLSTFVYAQSNNCTLVSKYSNLQLVSFKLDKDINKKLIEFKKKCTEEYKQNLFIINTHIDTINNMVYVFFICYSADEFL